MQYLKLQSHISDVVVNHWHCTSLIHKGFNCKTFTEGLKCVFGSSCDCLCSKNAHASHEVSRWHCLAFKHGWHLNINTAVTFCLLISLSLPLSHSLSLCLFSSACLFLSVYPLRTFHLSTEDPTVDLSMSSWASSSQTSSLSLTKLKHTHSSSSFASVQWQAPTGQFGKALSSCKEFPLQGIILSSEPVWVEYRGTLLQSQISEQVLKRRWGQMDEL